MFVKCEETNSLSLNKMMFLWKCWVENSFYKTSVLGFSLAVENMDSRQKLIQSAELPLKNKDSNPGNDTL